MRGGLSVGVSGRGLLAQLAGRVQAGGAAAIAVLESGAAVSPAGPFVVKPAAAWSVNAAAASGASYAGYRVVAGEVTLQPG